MILENSSQPGPTWVEEGGYYRISRYDEVTQICLDPDTFSSNLVAFVLKGAGDGTQIMEIPEGIPRQGMCWPLPMHRITPSTQTP